MKGGKREGRKEGDRAVDKILKMPHPQDSPILVSTNVGGVLRDFADVINVPRGFDLIMETL